MSGASTRPRRNPISTSESYAAAGRARASTNAGRELLAPGGGVDAGRPRGKHEIEFNADEVFTWVSGVRPPFAAEAAGYLPRALRAAERPHPPDILGPSS
jgi:hypothetical protein